MTRICRLIEPNRPMLTLNGRPFRYRHVSISTPLAPHFVSGGVVHEVPHKNYVSIEYLNGEEETHEIKNMFTSARKSGRMLTEIITNEN